MSNEKTPLLNVVSNHDDHDDHDHHDHDHAHGVQTPPSQSSLASFPGNIQGEEPIALKKKDKKDKKDKHKHHDHDHDKHDHHGHNHDEEKGHKHGHDDHDDDLADAKQRRKGQIALTLALILTTLFMIGEFVGGLYTGSLAIMTDAAHLLTDVGALLLSLFAMWLASRPKSKTLSYGFHRAEILGAVASVLMIWALTGVLVYEAILRTIRWCKDAHSLDIKAKPMFFIATGGLVINIVDAVILWWGGQEHAHGHDHGDDHGHGGHGHGHNVNVYSAFIHVIGDCIQSVGVMIAAALMWIFGKHFSLADPITTFVFSILVLYTTIGLLRNSLGVLMESVPRGIKPEKIMQDLQGLPGVQAVHDLHVWSLTVGKPSLSVHLKCAASTEPHALLKAANKVLKKNHGIKHTTIQIMSEDCDHGEICKF